RITASVRTLGQFTVMMDTTPPVLTPVGLLADMKGRKGFKVRVKDNLSGLDQWSARLDGQWILMEYEPKTHALEHHFDVHSDLPGTHEFELEVTDERGNRSRLTRTFTR
ncbi:MAG TPA: M23 family peptidase, partial [Flavobacteriales bacterium]|nr:M23 family peptidase [Flavobacteriales bacterium]